MNYSAIAIRYSKALFTLAEEKHKLDKVYKDITLIKSVCETEKSFQNLLHFPIIKSSKKISIFNELFSNKIDSLTLDFLKLISNNKREMHLLSMCYSFINLYKDAKFIQTVHFTSVNKIDRSTKNKIIGMLKKQHKGYIELIEHTDDNLIGGFILRIDDRQYDASVANSLKNIEREFING